MAPDVILAGAWLYALFAVLWVRGFATPHATPQQATPHAAHCHRYDSQIPWTL